MLSLLHIENIAIIEQADIVLQPGFTVLTGETGAGKSIIIDSIGAILGQRTSRELIRSSASWKNWAWTRRMTEPFASSASCRQKGAACAASICVRYLRPCSKR